jgi:phosphohistidine phosphatase
MRRLMLLRHAKAVVPMGLDIDRMLADMGREAAAVMGTYLKDEQLYPDLAVVSPARRTRETWTLVERAVGEVETRDEPRLYNASHERVLAVARGVEPAVSTLILVGHNPGFGELARMLVGHGDRYAFARMAKTFPTCGLAVIDFAVETWNDLEHRGGRLERFVTPGSLGATDDD